MARQFDPQVDFERKMTALRRVLSGVHAFLDIWAELDKPDNQVIFDQYAPYAAFFTWTKEAHAGMCYVRLAIATDGEESRRPSVYEVLKLVELNPALLRTQADVPALRARVDFHRENITKIMRYRHQMVAHREVRADPMPVGYDGTRLLLTELENIFNEIHRAWKPRQVWSFVPLQVPGDQTARLLTDIRALATR